MASLPAQDAIGRGLHWVAGTGGCMAHDGALLGISDGDSGDGPMRSAVVP